MTKAELERENAELKAQIKVLQETIIQMGQQTTYIPYQYPSTQPSSPWWTAGQYQHMDYADGRHTEVQW